MSAFPGDESGVEYLPDPNFKRKETSAIKQCLDSVNDLIKLCEQPEAFLGRKALSSLVDTLPIRTSHILKKH